MNIKVVEHNELIANRKSPGDSWILVDDPKKIIYTSLTDTLEAYLNTTGFKGEYRLAPKLQLNLVKNKWILKNIIFMEMNINRFGPHQNLYYI